MERQFILFLIFVSSIMAKGISEYNYIFTEGTGVVSIKPNYIVTKLGVSVVHPDPDSAILKTNNILDTILFTLKKYKIAENNIETHSSAFVREYKDNRDTTTYLGFKSESILKVTYHDLENFEQMLNELIHKGMNVLQSYDFKHTQEDSLKRNAAKLAFVEAKENAKAITMKSGRNLGRLLNVSYEKPSDYSVKPDFKLELSRSLSLSMTGGLRGNLELLSKQDLKYLRIIIPEIKFKNNVYTKFELK